MSGIRFLGVYTIVPTTILLTISFFVLFAVRKVEQQGLKRFGYVIAVLLWIAAALIFGTGVRIITTWRQPVMNCPLMEQEPMMKR